MHMKSPTTILHTRFKNLQKISKKQGYIILNALLISYRTKKQCYHTLLGAVIQGICNQMTAHKIDFNDARRVSIPIHKYTGILYNTI